MSGKRRRLKIDQKRASKRDAVRNSMPEGAVMADPAKQVPNNSYADPVWYYVDRPFQCVDCGDSEVWTGRQQKWYYEVAKGSLYATAVRCRSCRRKRARTHNGQGDPNRIKHPGSLIKHVQTAIAPAMTAAGFSFDGRSQLPVKGSVALDYARADRDVTCWFDRPNATLVAESLDRNAQCITIARVPLDASRSTAQLLDRIEEFTAAVIKYLADLPSL